MCIRDSGGADRSLVQWVERRLEEVGGPLGDAGPAAWTPTQVVAWLRTSPMMAEHAAAFAADEVDGAALLTLDEVDLLALASARSASASGCSTRSPSCAAPRPSSVRARRTPTAARRPTVRSATPS